MSKKCTRCKETKLTTKFYGAERSHCKECERTLARYRMGREENKIRTAYRDAKKQATKYGVYDDLTLDDVMYTFAISGGYCAYCGKLVGRDLQLEHIFCLSSGGHNTLANITTACRCCNLKKSNQAILTHLQTTSFDDMELINTLIERIAYRMGVDRIVVCDLLNQQQKDITRGQVKQLMERIKSEGTG